MVVIFDYHKSLFIQTLYFITSHCCIGLEDQVSHFCLIGHLMCILRGCEISTKIGWSENAVNQISRGVSYLMPIMRLWFDFVLVFRNGVFSPKMTQLLDLCTLYIFPASGRWFCPSLFGMIHCCCLRIHSSVYWVIRFIHLSQWIN